MTRLVESVIAIDDAGSMESYTLPSRCAFIMVSTHVAFVNFYETNPSILHIICSMSTLNNDASKPRICFRILSSTIKFVGDFQSATLTACLIKPWVVGSREVRVVAVPDQERGLQVWATWASVGLWAN
jgi:hypothetical protein